MAQFTRRIEDFTCTHCGAEVQGNGFTNHCPQCLWSLHVDVNPGDRAATCGHPMEPIGWSKKNGALMVHHRCTVCRAEKRNKLQAADNQEVLLRLGPA